ncbi:helix-turn-helix domain-containing protein [Marivirga sp.]|uniref:helix-turn-helix domain-containing protein n=1 Tax=Marivirga sp. TaxID=2018662 RepID=UPI003DA77C6F
MLKEHYNHGLDSFRAYIMEFKDRLQIFMADKNLSANGLATKMGYESGSRISRVLRGEGHPSFDFISKLCELYPELRMDWLIKGDGNMYKKAIYKEDEDKEPSKSSEPKIFYESGEMDIDDMVDELKKNQIDFFNKLKYLMKNKK